jgi:ABC-2 type transport system ATP-binding protein
VAPASAIRTRQLTKVYGDLTAVDRLDLSVQEGEVFGLLGPNGAGKTTTVLMLLGLSEPTSGSAAVLGLDPRRAPLEVKRRVGYLPDAVGFYEDLTGRENLRYTARLNGMRTAEADARIDDLLDEVGLATRGDDRVGTYSRGMRQRLGLADALVKDPSILILDEPTVAIDPEGVREILALIRRLPARGVTVLLSSHLLEQVQAICDRIGIFVQGRMVASGTIDELGRAHGGAPYTLEVATVGNDPRPALRSVPGITALREDGDLLVLDAVRDVREDVARKLAEQGSYLVHASVRREQLGEIYRRYFLEAEADGDHHD